MDVQKISIGLFVAILSIFLILVSIFFSSVILTSYADLEKQYLEKDLLQTINKLNDELLNMASTASDWGPWDDTVHYVQGNDPQYKTSNLQPVTFENLNLNLIVFTNKTGDIVYAGAYDLQSDEMVSPPLLFSNRIDNTNPLMNMSDIYSVTKGIVMLPEGPLLVVSQPIVYSDYSGTAQGVVIMGRYLNVEEISRLRNLTRPSLTFKQIDDPSLSKELVSTIRKHRNQSIGFIQVQNEDLISGYSLLYDIYGKEILVLQITEPRNIYHQGLNTTIQVLIIIFVGSLFLALSYLILQNQIVLKRMRSIAFQVSEIGQSGITTDRVFISGNDELSQLAEEINGMLDTIQKTQSKLLNSEKQFRDLVENLPDYIIVYGLNKEILYINPATTYVLGQNAESMVGKPVFQLIAEESRDIIYHPFSNENNSGVFPVYEIEILTQEGIRKTVIMKGRKIQFNNQSATLLLLIDITERKEYEKEREHHAQELKHYSSNLHRISRQLSLLTSITRHDILNKISIIYGYLDLIEIDNTDPLLSEYLSKMKSTTKEIQNQIEFTRVYEDLGTQEPQWIELDSVIPYASFPPSISCTVHIQDVLIYADPMFGKVFHNLLDNSIRHGEHVTEIKISTYETESGLVIVWEDNGVGISLDVKSRIFDRGFGKHTGLGMFLVKEILNLTRITIRETGEPGSGARFEMFVPSGVYQFHSLT